MKAIQTDAEEHKLSVVQSVILYNFRIIKDILEEEGIKYYMLGGTLLGAVRHQGFIPWDDDIDIGIEREDYERLLVTVAERLPDYLELQTFKNQTAHHYYFSRIVDRRHAVKRNGSLLEREENVWIDIFPLDGMPDNVILRKIHMARLLWVRTRYHISCFEQVNLKRPNRPLSERVIIKFVELTGWGRNGDTKKLLEKLDTLLKEYSIEKTGWIINFMGQYKFKEMFLKKYYGKGKLYPFEDLMLWGPVDADFVLKQMYGNYMRIPDDAEKNVHAAQLIE